MSTCSPNLIVTSHAFVLPGTGAINSAALNVFEETTLTNNLVAGYGGGFTCDFLLNYLDTNYATLDPNNRIGCGGAWFDSGSVNFGSVGDYPTTEDITVQLVVTESSGAVVYGFYLLHMVIHTGLVSVENHTTYPGGVVYLDDISNISQVSLNQLNGSSLVNYSTSVTQGVWTATNTEDFLACVIPACAAIPPSPPFPPYLPPSPSWPPITPAPTPPTASFPPGQPANQVLGIGANYTVFSNFGYKGNS